MQLFKESTPRKSIPNLKAIANEFVPEELDDWTLNQVLTWLPLTQLEKALISKYESALYRYADEGLRKSLIRANVIFVIRLKYSEISAQNA